MQFQPVGSAAKGVCQDQLLSSLNERGVKRVNLIGTRDIPKLGRIAGLEPPFDNISCPWPRQQALALLFQEDVQGMACCALSGVISGSRPGGDASACV